MSGIKTHLSYKHVDQWLEIENSTVNTSAKIPKKFTSFKGYWKTSHNKGITEKKQKFEEACAVWDLNKENVVIVVTDTTGNMITFSNKLRVEILIEYTFCVDHNLHRNSSKDFDGIWIVLSF